MSRIFYSTFGLQYTYVYCLIQYMFYQTQNPSILFYHRGIRCRTNGITFMETNAKGEKKLFFLKKPVGIFFYIYI